MTTRHACGALFALLVLSGCEADVAPAMSALPDQVSGAGGAGGVGGTQVGGASGASGAGGMSVLASGGSDGASGASGEPIDASVASGAGGAGGADAGAVVAPSEGVPTLFWLDITANRVMRSESFEPAETLVARVASAPDGVAVDVAARMLYWTNMGSALGTGGGSVQRVGLDGGDVETIVPPGIAQTPKQMQVDVAGQHIYFCDREGAKVWRAGLDGENPEAIVSGHGLQQLVGIAVDHPGGKFYFTDRNGKKILRANIAMPAGETGATRTDIEELFVMTGTAMPIDLDIDHEHQQLYWTDRELGTVKRMALELPAGEDASNRTDIETIATDLVEPIGISLDVAHDAVYFTELGGVVSKAALDGSGLEKGIFTSSSATGVALAYIPKR